MRRVVTWLASNTAEGRVYTENIFYIIRHSWKEYQHLTTEKRVTGADEKRVPLLLDSDHLICVNLERQTNSSARSSKGNSCTVWSLLSCQLPCAITWGLAA